VTITSDDGDAAAPIVTTFTTPSTSSSLNVPITAFVASDNVGVNGYLANESSVKPSATAGGWTSTAPTTHTFGSTGTKTLYGWAKDAVGNVSAYKSAVVTIDTAPPTGGLIWADQAVAVSASNYSAITYGVAVDTGGNAITVGSFRGSMDFGCGTLVSSPTSNGDIFIVKYSPTGSCMWSKHLNGTYLAAANSVAVDGSGNIVVAGYFNGSVNFGGGSVASDGQTALFIAKYSSAGAYQWAKGLGSSSTGGGTAYSVKTDNSGNIFVTGYFSSSLDFGGGPLTSAGGNDVFIAKYSPTGAYLWAKRMGGSSLDMGMSVAVDSSSNLVVTGRFAGTANFGGGSLTSSGGYDIFVAKYSTAGAHLWSKSFGSSAGDYGFSVAVDGYNDVILTGTFTGTIDFGGGPMSPAGGGDIFLAKYSSSGQYIWANHYGTTSTVASMSYAVATDAGDNIVLTGNVTGNINFGTGYLLSYDGSSDIFLVKFSPNGVNLWSKRFRGSMDDHGNAVTVDMNYDIFMVGDFYRSVDFGDGALTSAYAPDAFIAKFAP
jgi:hypothetical protein